MRALIVLSLAVWAGMPAYGSSPEELGDQAFRLRSTGFSESGRPDSAAVARAVASYEAALANEPEKIGLYVKLMDALYFQGYYIIRDRREQRQIFDRVVALGERAQELTRELAGAGPELARKPSAEVAAALQSVPEAAAVHFWSAAGWGLWGVTHSPLNAVRRGVATKVRRHSEIASLLDERYEHAGGLRFLGQLHATAPRVPFITGWVDRELGVSLLRQAVSLSRQDPRNLLFLAQAILEHEPANRNEAVALLRELDRYSSHPEELAEHHETLVEAQELLAELVEPDGSAGR